MSQTAPHLIFSLLGIIENNVSEIKSSASSRAKIKGIKMKKTLLASALTTSLFISIFGDVGVIIATIIMTSLVVIFAEILPKVLALKYSDRWALKAALFIKITVKILGPIANLAQKASSYFVKDNNNSEKRVDAQDELRGQISIHHQEGEV